MLKEKLIEMQEEQSQSVNDEVKRAMNLTFQRLKTRFQVEVQYTGEEILSRALEVIKKVTVNILSNTEEEDTPEEDQPTNGENVDQQTLTEEVTSTENEQPKNNNGWDTVDDLPGEEPPAEEPVVKNEEAEETTVPPVPDDQDSDTVESTSQLELPKDPSSEEEGKSSPLLSSLHSSFAENDESFQSARPSVQEVVATPPPPSPRVNPFLFASHSISSLHFLL